MSGRNEESGFIELLSLTSTTLLWVLREGSTTSLLAKLLEVVGTLLFEMDLCNLQLLYLLEIPPFSRNDIANRIGNIKIFSIFDKPLTQHK